ncbi:unnamed protein product [Fraxinus pennsylvanica]|uniref:ER lumen protein-retaining receptor n=1 Tax=Fraxinus pennsylvanica TaxID=56036 RepID=A0AAD1Z1X3_9LAMI|nr:unnamed protein product [Fraxinus pennsylvanica]
MGLRQFSSNRTSQSFLLCSTNSTLQPLLRNVGAAVAIATPAGGAGTGKEKMGGIGSPRERKKMRDQRSVLRNNKKKEIVGSSVFWDIRFFSGRSIQEGKMNIFRLAGDMTHLASVLVLLLKIHTIKSCAGISLKTQELYALVFATRYLDLFTDYISLYNTLMKLIFLGSSFSIVWYIRHHKIVRRSYDKDQDTFRHYFLVLPCFLLALVINEKFTVKEIMWTFSLYLEAVAILPQLVLLQRTRNIDNLTGQYVFLLGAYRSLYILNWIYRFFTEPHYVHWITWISGLVQTLLYADFFYYYFQSWKNNVKLQLPA